MTTNRKSNQKKVTNQEVQNQAQPKKPNNKVGAASVSAILGKPKGRSSTPTIDEIKPEWRKYYKLLIDLRERLIHQMNNLAKDSAEQIPTPSLHMAESGTDNFERDFALSLLSSDQDALYEIDEALKRMQKGTYGICELTGKPIPKSRLEAIPWARFTVEAQAQLEKEGLLKKKHFANLGELDLQVPIEGQEEEEIEEKTKEKD